MKSHRRHRSTGVVVLVSVRGTLALGRTGVADGAAAVGPFPIVAMIWPWELKNSCGDMVWTCRPWAGNAEAAAGLNSRGSVPITWNTGIKIKRLGFKKNCVKGKCVYWINKCTFKCSTNLALCIGNELTCHIRNSTGDDGSCS